MVISKLHTAVQQMQNGKIIAYPTEAVYGIGCDPFNEQAVLKLLALKHRSSSKGLIILIANWSQLTPLIAPIPDGLLSHVQATWPGHVTWIFPKSSLIPSWISGNQPTVAIRMSAHPIARQLCMQGPVVSTSANISGREPARDIMELFNQFPQGIDVLIEGDIGDQQNPSAIYDVLTGERLR